MALSSIRRINPYASPEEAEPFAAYLLEKKSGTRVVDQDGTKKTVHYVTMAMVSNLPMKQAEKYRPLVHQFAEQYRHQPQSGLRHHPHREQLQPLCRQLGPRLWTHATGPHQRRS